MESKYFQLSWIRYCSLCDLFVQFFRFGFLNQQSSSDRVFEMRRRCEASTYACTNTGRLLELVRLVETKSSGLGFLFCSLALI
jgi:hypothetical protein